VRVRHVMRLRRLSGRFARGFDALG
jgi:hypothetical protein